jgi:putative glutamine amidotransferase
MTTLLATNDFYSSFLPFFRDLEVYDGKRTPPDTKLVIFSGGEDISPDLYGDSNKYSMSINRERDKIEVNLFNFISNNRPEIKMLGVCRGHQLINALYGGSLVQDIFLEGYPSHGYLHDLEINNPPKYPVLINFYKRWSKTREQVNSLHHQGIKNLTYSLHGVFSHHGIIEACENKNVVTVQWHPEFIGDEEFFSWIKEWSK